MQVHLNDQPLEITKALKTTIITSSPLQFYYIFLSNMSFRLLNLYHIHIIFIILASNYTTFGLTTNETDQQALLSVKHFITSDPFNTLSSWNVSLHFCHWIGVTCNPRRQRVTKLDLSSLQLTGALSPHIGNLSFLKAINLENNTFRGQIPQEIGQLFRLQNLSLQVNSFQGKIPINISHCTNIKYSSI